MTSICVDGLSRATEQGPNVFTLYNLIGAIRNVIPNADNAAMANICADGLYSATECGANTRDLGCLAQSIPAEFDVVTEILSDLLLKAKSNRMEEDKIANLDNAVPPGMYYAVKLLTDRKLADAGFISTEISHGRR